jgi:GNAT superfamily N-acetyltransferase
MPYEIQKGDYLVSDDKQKIDLTFVHEYLSKESYWAQNIPVDVVTRSIENSISYGVYHSGKQVGFARVVTDKATFAYLADVFIIESYRGKGLSRMLLECIHAHPDVQGLRRWMLGTRDAHGLYTKFGWTPIPYPDRFMQLHFPDVYKKD